MRDDRGSVSPWAFFPPVLLAVLIGNVGADLVARMWQDEAPPAISTVAAEVHDVAPAGAPSSPDAPVARPEPVAEPVAVAIPAEAGGAPALAAAPASALPAPAAGGLRRLSGPSTARAAGESESCIGGTVALRSSNGLEQSLIDDAPVPCESVSP